MINYLPNFKITPAQIIPDLKNLLDTQLSRIKNSLDNPSYATLFAVLDDASNQIQRFWSPISHLNSVMNNPELREAHAQALPLLADYSTSLGHYEPLYQAIKLIKEQEYNNLTPAQQRVITHELRDFHLAGVDLPDNQKKQLSALMKQHSALTSQFENNVLDATNHWQKILPEVPGLPQQALDMTKIDSGYRLTLDFPCYHAVMTYAQDRSLREDMYHAFVTRASEFGEFDNTKIMQDLLEIRSEQSTLLGFSNYTDLSLATKMADSPEQVLSFLTQLAEKIHPKAKLEYQALCEFANIDLRPWDISYYSEKLRQSQYNLDQESLRQYFPETQVIQGLFTVTEKLYRIKFIENKDFDHYHPDQKCYDIFDNSHHLIGHVYFDLYARPKKRGGAWMDDYQGRWKHNNNLQLPVAYLNCNFGASKLLHDEVITLFHEFGHCLHHLLTQIDELGISGINGVEWDAVELPSQFFENWAWDFESLSLLSNNTLPKEIYNKMLAAKNFQSAMHLIRQLELALFDFQIHNQYPTDIQQSLNALLEKYTVVPLVDYNRFQHSFTHIFAGGYSAGYYSYLWADVLAADAFDRFEAEGIFNPQTGMDFLSEILSRGGSRPALESFIAFRGRAPDQQAFLKHHGIQ